MSKLTTEQLLKIAKEENLVKNNIKHKKPINDVHRFILSLNIKAGKCDVSYTIAYEAYKMWSYKPLSRRQFLWAFSAFFKTKYRCYFYKLNYSPIELLNKVDNLKIKIK